jgi:hypothetical protein
MNGHLAPAALAAPKYPPTGSNHETGWLLTATLGIMMKRQTSVLQEIEPGYPSRPARTGYRMSNRLLHNNHYIREIMLQR